MKFRWAAALAASCIVAACSQEQEPATSRPVSGASASKTAITPESALAAWRADLRLPPDTRCLRAVSTLRELTDGTAGTVSSRYDDASATWTVLSGSRPVGTLPELPDLTDCFGLLAAGTSSGSAPLDASPPPAKAFDGADQLLESLRTLDDGTPVASWPIDRVEAVAWSLLYLRVQGMDFMDIDERLPALMLAFDALATQRSGVVRASRRALLAHELGYTATARKLAAVLPEGNPIRMFVLGEDDALRRVASESYTDGLLNFLVLRRLAERGDYPGWSQWVGRYTLRDMPIWSIWQTACRLNAFGLQQHADAIPYILTAQMRFAAQREALQGWFAKLGLSVDKANVFALLDKVLLNTAFSGGVLNDFESALADRSARFKGRVVDAALVQAYFKSYFYSSVYMAGQHRLDRLGSIPSAKAWVQTVSAGSTPVVKAYAEFYTQLVAAQEGSTTLEALLGTVGQPGPLGAEPRKRLFRAIADGYLPWGSRQNRAALRTIRPFLDSRPAHASFMSGQLRSLLFELNLSEELFAHSSANHQSNDAWEVAWSASLRGDSTTLLGLLDNPRVQLKDKRHAISLLEGALEPAALDAACRRIAREGANDFETVQWFAGRELDGKRPTAAREAVTAWLKLGLPDPGLQRAIASARLSRAYFAEGNFKSAWNAVAPMLSSGQGGVMTRAAWAASRLGRRQDAQQLWDAVVARYGQYPDTRIEYLKFLWDQRRHAEAAEVIGRWPRPLQSQDGSSKLASAFYESTREWPDVEIIEAFAAIRDKGHADHLLRPMPGRFSANGRHELAFKMRQELTGPPLMQVELRTEAYQDLARFQGKESALAWLKTAIPEPMLNPASMVFFKAREPDLLWDMIPDASGSFSEWVWLIRAAAAIRDSAPGPERMEQLREYFGRASDDPVQLLGRYLLNLQSEEDVLRYPWPADRVYEAAYFLGLKNQCDGKLAQASDWYQVVLDLARENTGEFHWAQDQLNDWAMAGRLISRQPSGCAVQGDKGQPPGA